jgi:hypothetical protein
MAVRKEDQYSYSICSAAIRMHTIAFVEEIGDYRKRACIGVQTIDQGRHAWWRPEVLQEAV